MCRSLCGMDRQTGHMVLQHNRHPPTLGAANYIDGPDLLVPIITGNYSSFCQQNEKQITGINIQSLFSYTGLPFPQINTQHVGDFALKINCSLDGGYWTDAA